MQPKIQHIEISKSESGEEEYLKFYAHYTMTENGEELPDQGGIYSSSFRTTNLPSEISLDFNSLASFFEGQINA